jgi:outer membrane biosynthesis protein TonB
MVRKLKVTAIESSEAAATSTTDQVQSATDHESQTKPEVALFEATLDTEGLDTAAVEASAPEEPATKPIIVDFSADAPRTKVIEQVSCKDCGKSMSAKNLRYSHAKSCTARKSEPPPVAETPPPEKSPEVEETPATPGEKEKQPPPKRTRPKAKPKAQPQQDSREPTHAPDEVPEPGPPPPSRAPKQKLETPDQFWSNTLKQMKDRKNQQYQKLAAAAF